MPGTLVRIWSPLDLTMRYLIHVHTFLLTFAVTIQCQFLNLRAVGNQTGKAGVPFRRKEQAQLPHTGHRLGTMACLEVNEGLL